MLSKFWNKDDRCRKSYCKDRGASCEPLADVGLVVDFLWVNSCPCACVCKLGSVYFPLRDVCSGRVTTDAPDYTELTTESDESSTSFTTSDPEPATTSSPYASVYTSSTVRAPTTERLITGPDSTSVGAPLKPTSSGTALVVGLTLSLFAVALVLLLTVFWWRRRRKKDDRSYAKYTADGSSEYQCLDLPAGSPGEYTAAAPRGSSVTVAGPKYVPVANPPRPDAAEYNYIESNPHSQDAGETSQGVATYPLHAAAQPPVEAAQGGTGRPETALREESDYREIYYGRSPELSAASSTTPEYREVYYVGVPAASGGTSPPGSPIYQAAEEATNRPSPAAVASNMVYQDLSYQTSPVYQALNEGVKS